MHEVLINGGGPVGMALAIELGQRGIDTCVIERHAAPQRVPKGQNLTQRTMEHMRHWGVEAAIRDAKTIPKGVGLGGLTAYGSLLSGYHYDWFRRGTVQPYYAAENERLPQYATEEVLRARVAELPSVKVHYGLSGKSVEQDDDSATLTTEDGQQFTARYIVGCDGSRSCVRTTAGITETRRDHDRPMALLVFRSPEFFKLLDRFPDKQFYNVLHPDLDGYWMFFGMVDWSSSFFFHAPVPAGIDRDNFDFAAYLHRAVGREFELELDYVGFWDLRIAYANSYRNGRVFIAGDAAHSHPPYGGYGINTGFEDARNLGWKLCARVLGWAGDALLNSYDAERRPVFESTARDFIEAFIEEDQKFLRNYSPTTDKSAFEEAWAQRAAGGSTAGISSFVPNYDGSPIVTGTPDAAPNALGTHEFTARAGHHLAPQVLSDGRTVHEQLGDGFSLLAFETDISKFVNAAQARNIPLTVINGKKHSAAHDAYGATMILIRPDHFVAWVGEASTDPALLLRHVLGGVD